MGREAIRGQVPEAHDLKAADLVSWHSHLKPSPLTLIFLPLLFPLSYHHAPALFPTPQYAPLALLAVHAIFLALGTGSLAQVLLCSAGFITTWVFLRFYQTRNGVKGDPSDAFGFESFFPSPMQ